MDEPTPVEGDDATLLKRFLAGRDVDCPRCGYNLRASTGDRCAECGTVVRLGVHPIEPVLRAWIVASASASIAAGIGLLFVALVVGGKQFPPRPWFWVCLASWAFIPAAAVLWSTRRRFVRLASGAQWTIAWLCVIVVVVMLARITQLR